MGFNCTGPNIEIHIQLNCGQGIAMFTILGHYCTKITMIVRVQLIYTNLAHYMVEFTTATLRYNTLYAYICTHMHMNIHAHAHAHVCCTAMYAVPVYSRDRLSPSHSPLLRQYAAKVSMISRCSIYIPTSTTSHNALWNTGADPGLVKRWGGDGVRIA